MSASLPEFFEHMESFLLGKTDAEALENALGPSPSGRAPLAFYRTLVDRNFHKTLRQLFPSVCTLARRVGNDTWTEIVHAYVAAHPPRGCRDPNRMGAVFSEFLVRRREAGGVLGAIAEELAEYHWVNYLAKTSTDVEGDGFDKRVFIRQYSYRIPDYMRAITADESAPEPEPAPTVVVLYRSLRHGAVRIVYPTAQMMAVFASRQGLALPAPLAQLDPETIVAAEAQLIELGVLTASPI